MLGMMVALSALMLTATSCEKSSPIPEIQGCQEIICEAGDRPTISFTAGADWSLSSDQLWCQFITSAGELQEMAGNAGTHTVTLKITNEDIKNRPTFANITIKMGDKKGIIAKVERGADELSMKLYSITDTPIDAIELGYIDWIPFRLEANFRFVATEIPDWIEIGHKDTDDNMVIDNSITGVPGEQTEAYARIVNDGDRERFAIKEDDGYTMKFSDLSGEHIFEFPITYAGMGGDELTFVGPTEQYYGWEVSLDGKKFRQVNSQNNQTSNFSNELEFFITAHKSEYQIIRFDKIVERGIASYKYYLENNTSNDASSWINISRDKDDNGVLTITVKSTNTTRHGMVMALPKTIYSNTVSDLLGNLFEMDSSSGIELPVVKGKYQKYILMELTQHDLAERGEYEGMYAYHSITTLEIPCEAYSDSALTEEYGDVEIFKCDFVNSVPEKNPGIIIDPRIEGWTTESYESGSASAEVWLGERRLTMKDGEYYMGENKDERMALHLWGPKNGWGDENVIIIFKVGDTVKKVLVVTPPEK